MWWERPRTTAVAPTTASSHRIFPVTQTRRRILPGTGVGDEVIAVSDDAAKRQATGSGRPRHGRLVSIASAAIYGDRLAGAIIVDAPVRKQDPESDAGTRRQGLSRPEDVSRPSDRHAHSQAHPEQLSSMALTSHSTTATRLRRTEPRVANSIRVCSCGPLSRHRAIILPMCAVALPDAERVSRHRSPTRNTCTSCQPELPLVEIPQAHPT